MASWPNFEYFLINRKSIPYELEEYLLTRLKTSALSQREESIRKPAVERITKWFCRVWLKRFLRGDLWNESARVSSYEILPKSYNAGPSSVAADQAMVRIRFESQVERQVEHIEVPFYGQPVRFPGRACGVSKECLLVMSTNSYEYKCFRESNKYPKYLEPSALLLHLAGINILDWMIACPEELPQDVTRLSVDAALEKQEAWHQAQQGGPVMSGFTPPTQEIGEVGDYYIDIAASMLYGPKLNTGWPEPVPLATPTEVDAAVNRTKKDPSKALTDGVNVCLGEHEGWKVEALCSQQSLLYEGRKQHHCVASYWPFVKAATCVILRMTGPENVFTVEVTQQEAKPWYIGNPLSSKEPRSLTINQVRGVCNVLPSYVEESIINSLVHGVFPNRIREIFNVLSLRAPNSFDEPIGWSKIPELKAQLEDRFKRGDYA